MGINQYPSKPPLIRGGNAYNSNISKIPQKPQTDTNLSPNRHIALSPSIRKVAFTLAEGATHVGTWKDKCRDAFTLAEVLITLAVIGVVAAMTLPNVIKNYQKQVKLNKLKKFYSQFEQLIIRSVDENNEIIIWSEEDLQNGNSDKILEQYNLLRL